MKSDSSQEQDKLGEIPNTHEFIQSSLITTSNSNFPTSPAWQKCTPVNSMVTESLNSTAFPIPTCVSELKSNPASVIVTSCHPMKPVQSAINVSLLRTTHANRCSQASRFILPHTSAAPASVNSLTPQPDKLISTSAPSHLQLICNSSSPAICKSEPLLEMVSKPVVYYNTPPLNTSAGNSSLFLLPHSATLALAAAAAVQQNLSRSQPPLTATVTDATSNFLTPKMTTQILLIQTSASSCLQKTLNIISLANQQQSTVVKTSPTVSMPYTPLPVPTLPPFTSLSTFCGARERFKPEEVLHSVVAEKKDVNSASPTRFRGTKVLLAAAAAAAAATPSEGNGQRNAGWSESGGTPRRRHQCPYCTKTCERKDNLQAHIRTHTGERPYPCRFCPKAFPQKDHLRAHIRTHTGEKPYRCPQCAKAFAQLGNLHRHVKTHRR